MKPKSRKQKEAILKNYCANHDCKANDCIFCEQDGVCGQGNHWGVNDGELNRLVDMIQATDKNDVVNHPSHYTNGGMECFDEMRLVFGDAVVAHFCLCNAWKYRYRALYKNGEEDIKKSHWYMSKYKELTSDGKQG